MFIIFEGLDKVGKGTLEIDFLKRTDWKDIVIDRGPAGYKTFDQVYDRETPTGNDEFDRLIDVINNSPDDYIVIYLEAPWSIVQNRLRDHDEVVDYDYIKAQSIYKNNVMKYNPEQVLFLNTDKSIEECSDIITYFVSSYKKDKHKI